MNVPTMDITATNSDAGMTMAYSRGGKRSKMTESSTNGWKTRVGGRRAGRARKW